MKKWLCVIFLAVITACSTAYNAKEVQIKNADNQDIAVEVFKPSDTSGNQLAFIQHGLAADKEHTVVQTLKQAFLDKGYTVVLFDSRFSIGKSFGGVENARLKTFDEDLNTVIGWAETQEFYHQPFALAGHSLGAAAVLVYTYEHPEKVSLTIPVTPVVSGQNWEDTCMQNMPDFCRNWKQNGYYEYKPFGKPATISYQTVEDAKSYDAKEILPAIKTPVLLVAGEDDKVVNPEAISGLSAYMSSEDKLEIVPHSGHNFENKGNLDDLYNAVSEFIK